MPYALVQDYPASWTLYERLAGIAGPAPAGLIVHVAGPTDEGFRTIEVWETRADWERFEADRPAAHTRDVAVRPLAEPTLRALEALSAVHGVAPITERSHAPHVY